MSDQLQTLANLPLGEIPGTHWIVGYVGQRAGLDGLGKQKICCTFRNSNPKRSSL